MTIEEIENLVETLVKKRERVEELKKPYVEAQDELASFEGKVLMALAEIGKKSYQSEKFGTITRRMDQRYSLPQGVEEREAFFSFLKEKDVFDNMITLNANTFNSFCKQEFEAAAQADPEAAMHFKIPGVKEPNVREILSLTKPKGSK